MKINQLFIVGAVSWVFLSLGASSGLALGQEDVVQAFRETAGLLLQAPYPELQKLGQSCQLFIQQTESGSTRVRFLPGTQDPGCRAFFDPQSGTIYVRKDLSYPELQLVIVHEITHFQQKTVKSLSFRVFSSASEVTFSPGKDCRIGFEAEAFGNALDFYCLYLASIYGDPKALSRGAEEDSLPPWLRTLSLYARARDMGKANKLLTLLYDK